MFVGAYWASRKETRGEAAARIVGFLTRASELDPAYSTWYALAKSKRAALKKKIELAPPSIEAVLRYNREGRAGPPILELGVSIGIWNGRSAGFSSQIGGTSKFVGNNALLKISDSSQDKPFLRAVLVAAIQAFDPDHAVVTDTATMKSSGAKNPWDAGLFIYHRGGSIIEPQ